LPEVTRTPASPAFGIGYCRPLLSAKPSFLPTEMTEFELYGVGSNWCEQNVDLTGWCKQNRGEVPDLHFLYR
jgi:hypothetical protein